MHSWNLKQIVLAVWSLGIGLNVYAETGKEPVEKKTEALRVCADPGNMPMSNDKGEGYANKIASIIAEGLGTQVTYFYRPYLNRGLTRQTFDNNECDILMEMTPEDERMLTTKPLYKSTFVLAYRNDKGMDIKSLHDPKLLNDYKVGVFQHSAIRTVLQERGIKRENTIVRTIAHDADLLPERQPHMDVQNMIDGKLDVAAIWGPMAGWYQTIKKAPITIVPVNRLEDGIPMEFPLAIGMRRNAKELKANIEAVMLKEKDKIRKVFEDYGVPLVQCDECVISGNLPSHGPYKKVARKSHVPPQSDPTTLPARIEQALKQGSSLEQELVNATIARDNPRIEYILKRGAKIDYQDVEGYTALIHAVKSGDLSVINGLLAYEANPNIQDNDGWTAAMHGVRANEPKVFRLLGKYNADFNVVNKYGLTALAMAVIDNRANAAVAMLDHNADPDFAMGEAKFNALMLAVTKGNQTMSQTLLQYKANPNAVNIDGVTPLMVAAKHNHENVLMLLLKSGANPNLKDKQGNTALAIAKQNASQKSVELLQGSM